MWASFDFLWLKYHRTKWDRWSKKFETMDDLVVAFEIRNEEEPALEPWLKELEAKYNHMKEFKKKFHKYNMGLEASLKKVGAYDRKCANAHAKFTS